MQQVQGVRTVINEIDTLSRNISQAKQDAGAGQLDGRRVQAVPCL
jgi:hypothetical protein